MQAVYMRRDGDVFFRVSRDEANNTIAGMTLSS